MTVIDDYTVALARPEHIACLAEIERAAASQFPDDVLTPGNRSSVVPREQLEAALVEQRLWTALAPMGTVVGFAIAMRQSHVAFLREVDVHPAHQCRGLGRLLVGEVIGWAREHGLSRVVLTTFEHVPWNAPFYSKLGFRRLAGDDLSRELRDRLEVERSQGLRQRIAMQLALPQQ